MHDAHPSELVRAARRVGRASFYNLHVTCEFRKLTDMIVTRVRIKIYFETCPGSKGSSVLLMRTVFLTLKIYNFITEEPFIV
jgi:hypothetical protein